MLNLLPNELLYGVYKRLDDRKDKDSLLQCNKPTRTTILSQCQRLTVHVQPPHWNDAVAMDKFQALVLRNQTRELNYYGGGPILLQQLLLCTHNCLKRLKVTHPSWMYLPELLPDSLQMLDCSGCECLERLPEPLPMGLQTLVCSDCWFLERLPEPLPIGLQKLVCSGCYSLRRLPEHMPDTLRMLDCSGCKGLWRLPEHLPASLRELVCSGCTALERLPTQASGLLGERAELA